MNKNEIIGSVLVKEYVLHFSLLKTLQQVLLSELPPVVGCNMFYIPLNVSDRTWTKKSSALDSFLFFNLHFLNFSFLISQVFSLW